MNEEQIKRAGKVDSLVLPWHERPEANLQLNFDVSPFKPKIHDSIDKTQPANQQDYEMEESKVDDSFVDTERGDYFSEKKSVPTIPIMNNKEKFGLKVVPFSE